MIRTHDAVIVTTVYPGVEKYFASFMQSLYAQTTHAFDLLIGNDGAAINFKESCAGEIPFHKIDLSGDITQNRLELIRVALELGYKTVIFADADDRFAANRVETIEKYIDINGIVVNDLSLMSGDGTIYEGNYFSKRLANLQLVGINDIRTKNMLGLSNTAISSELLHEFSLEKVDVVAFDWYMWTCLLEKGFHARFVNETSTLYRIYGNNMAGLPQSLEYASIKRCVEVKLAHYKAVERLHTCYQPLLNRYVSLNQRLNDVNDCNEILKDNIVESEYPFWWEGVK